MGTQARQNARQAASAAWLSGRSKLNNNTWLADREAKLRLESVALSAADNRREAGR